MKYQCKATGISEIIWNSRDAVTPFGITMLDGSEGVHVEWQNDKYAPWHVPKIGDRIFVNLSLDHASVSRMEFVERFWDHPEVPMCKEFANKWDAISKLAAADVASFGIGTTPHVVVVDEWILADLQSRRVPREPYRPREFASPISTTAKETARGSARRARGNVMKFGDIIENTWAGERNPQRILMFVRNSGEYVCCLSRKGEGVKFYRHDQKKDKFLVVRSCVDFAEWDKVFAAETEER
jgi:hypothetical protein